MWRFVALTRGGLACTDSSARNFLRACASAWGGGFSFRSQISEFHCSPVRSMQSSKSKLLHWASKKERNMDEYIEDDGCIELRVLS